MTEQHASAQRPAGLKSRHSDSMTMPASPTATLIEEDIIAEPQLQVAALEVQVKSLQDGAAQSDTTVATLEAQVKALQASVAKSDDKIDCLINEYKRLGEALIVTQQKLKRRFNAPRWADV